MSFYCKVTHQLINGRSLMRRQSLAVAAFSMIAVLAAAVGLLPAPAASKTIFDKNVQVTSAIKNWLNLTCGGEGQSCCKPVFSLPSSLQPMVSCAELAPKV